MALGACGRGDDAGGGQRGPGGPGGRQAPVVTIATIEPVRFADTIEAVGTAYAKESTVLASTVTERIVRLNFRDGEQVRKGDVIAELARTEEAADLAGAQAQVREAEQQLQRLRALQKQGFATNARVDEQLALLNAARARAGAVSAQIGDRVIRAPFNGVIGLRRISVGATVSAGTEIATVADISSIKLDFSVPESFLGAIRTGQPIEARAAAYSNELFKGEIEGIDPIVDPATRSVIVRAVLPNADRRLRPGMLLTVSIISNPRMVVAVPELALVAEADRTFAFKVDSEMTALRTPVRTGSRQNGLVEITRGLKPGDRIVAEGVVKVRDGGKVRDHDAADGGERGGAATAKGDRGG
ncbi:MAG: efflux RND transporter periplasmic adaptor subunit, partial [Alphaproteobacteria bacterium]|nr:efflux RND transporter periplasmic adaptor subunit [Alphaproteobacteria bacterium]